jgi:hypothetical protein
MVFRSSLLRTSWTLSLSFDLTIRGNGVSLVPDVLIRGNDYVEPGALSFVQEFAVFKLPGPTHFIERADVVAREEGANPYRDILIEDDAQNDGL